jgi:hypothetical protein
MSKTACRPLGYIEAVNGFKFGVHDFLDDHLGKTHAPGYREGFFS